MSGGIFNVTWSHECLTGVISCHYAKAKRKDQPGTWITQQMQDAYIGLSRAGHAASVEVWMDGMLVGGLYGVLMGDVFCGKACLFW